MQTCGQERVGNSFCDSSIRCFAGCKAFLLRMGLRPRGSSCLPSTCPQPFSEAGKGKEPNQGTKQGTRQGNARNIASRQGTKVKDRGQRQGTRHPGKQQRRCRQATEDKGHKVAHIRGVPCFARVHSQHTDTCTHKIHPDTHTPTHPQRDESTASSLFIPACVVVHVFFLCSRRVALSRVPPSNSERGRANSTHPCKCKLKNAKTK